MDTTRGIDIEGISPDAVRAVLGLERYVRNSSIEPELLELMKLRASYQNGCAYCVDMHTKDARAAGESEQRLFAVPVWRETPFFTPRERAALAWTESVTALAAGGVPKHVYDAVRAEFSEAEIVDLTLAVVAINCWNRIAISLGADVGSYTPEAHHHQQKEPASPAR